MPRTVIYGEKACFTNPIFNAEKETYPVITPSAIRAILRAYYWHPGVHYKINKFGIINKGTIENIVVNERKNNTGEVRNQRIYRTIMNPSYIVDFDIVSDDAYAKQYYEKRGKEVPTFNYNKSLSILTRNIETDDYYNTPYMGVSQYLATMRFATPEDEEKMIKENHNYGYITHHCETIGKKRVWFVFEAIMNNGWIEVENPIAVNA